MVSKVMFETKDCIGCKTCMIACSYHHKNIFRPSISSIEIKRGEKAPSFTISFNRSDGNGHLACDGCKELEEPLCIEYCNIIARDELRNLLNELLSDG